MNAEAISRKLPFDSSVHDIAIELLDANPNQSRDSFDPEELAHLAASLSTQGMLQPIIVRTMVAGRYQIIAGERRWRAAQRAGWLSIPALVRHVNDAEAAGIALAENELRVQVGRMETARAAQAMIDRYGYTHEELGAILGIDRTSITNLLRLLTLDSELQAMIGEGPGRVSPGHAKVLMGVSPERQRILARRVVEQGLSVRALERQINRLTERATRGRSRQVPDHEPDIRRLQRQLADLLCLPVSIEWPSRQFQKGGTQRPERVLGDKAGSVQIRFRTIKELYGLIDRIRDPLD